MRIFGETRWVFVGVFCALLSGVGAYFFHNQDEIKNVPSGPEIAQLLKNTVADAELVFANVKAKVMDIIDSAKEPQVVSVDPRVKKPSAEPAEEKAPPSPENATEDTSSASQVAPSEQAPSVEVTEKIEAAENMEVVEEAKVAELPKDDFSRAVEFNKLGKFEEAIALLEASKDKTDLDQLKKEYFVAYTGLGTKLRKEGDCETAIGYFKKAFSTNLTDPASPLNLSACYIGLNRLDDAEPMIKEALNLSADKAKVYFSLGLSYSDAKLPEKALAAYNKALEIGPNQWQDVYGLGHELFTLGKVAEGIKLLKAAEKMSPKPGDVYWSLSMAYCKMKNGQKARDYYLKLLKLKHPKINTVANYLGQHCADKAKEPLAMNTVQ